QIGNRLWEWHRPVAYLAHHRQMRVGDEIGPDHVRISESRTCGRRSDTGARGPDIAGDPRSHLAVILLEEPSHQSVLFGDAVIAAHYIVARVCLGAQAVVDQAVRTG